MTNPIIICHDLGKSYLLYENPRDRLLDSLTGLRRRLLGGRQLLRGRMHRAVDQVSFTMNRGETVALIGRNGSGKSTLLQLIAGTLNPTAGQVHVDGRISALLELGAGFNPEFSGIENVRLSAGIQGLSALEIERRMDEILAFAGIGDFAAQPVKTYSSGMYVRLAFAVAIHVDPDVLIVDEALAVGDMAFQAKCMARIRRFQEEGKTLLFVSHDIAAVRSLCDRAIYLEAGRVIDMGETSRVADRYLRDLHEELNEALQAVPIHAPALTAVSEPLREAWPEPELEARFVRFEGEIGGERHGTGEARVRLVELLDEQGQALQVAEFEQPVRVRIWVECLASCALSVNYKIRNRLLDSVAGADLLIVGQGAMPMAPGKLYRVDYDSRLALKDGDYSLRISLTVPVDRHAGAVFVDVIESTCHFRVLPAERGHIYTAAYLPNEVTICEC